MKPNRLNLDDFRPFAATGLFVVVFGWSVFLLALAGWFHPSLILAAFAIPLFATGGWLWKNYASSRNSRELPAVFLAAAIISGFFSFYVTPTVFSGRDQGSFSQAAIRLAENRKLEFSDPASREFFKIYGPGKALNYPGFYYPE